ncbi:Ig-like domain repeat protein [Paraconexibacter algicola]|nr:Ig-like domain repeat protein [Paraconexibacter algicola]
MRTTTRRPLAAVLTLPLAALLTTTALAAPAAHAAAFPTGTLDCYVDRTDSLGWLWDVRQDGTIGNGGGDSVDEPVSGLYDGAFDEFPELEVDGDTWFPQNAGCGRALAGREVTTPVEPAGVTPGVVAQRAVYVPRTGPAVARLRTALTNTTAAPVTVDVRFDGEFDSNADDAFVLRGTGEAPGVVDTDLTGDDRWLAFDMTNPDGVLIDAGTLLLVDGFGAPADRYDTLTFPLTPDPEAVTWDYGAVTIAPDETVEFVQFAGQRDEALPFQLDADGVYRASDELWAGMSARERARVRNWDAREPDTTVTAGPGTTNDTTPAFTFTGSLGPVTFECRVHPVQTGFTPCAPGVGLHALADGDYRLDVRARRAATLVVDESPASRAFTIDTDAPTAEITSGPTGRQATASATFTYRADEQGVTYQCRLQPIGGYESCGPTASFPALTDGAYTFDVFATDVAGNRSPVESRSFTVDTTPPDTTLTATPAALSSNTTPTFAFTSAAGATFRCRVGTSGPFETCASPLTLPSLDDGAYAFQVRAVDDVGNADATPASFAFTVDTTAPRTTIDSGPSGRVASTTAAFTFSVTGGPTLTECSLDGAAFGACVSPVSSTGLAEGTHTLDVRSRDAAGNVEAPVRRTWTVDVSAPDTTLTLVPAAVSSDTTPTFGFSASEAGATFVCALDGGSYDTCSSPRTTAMLAEGEHTFAVAARDDLGNVDPTPATYAFTIDSAPSTTTITSGPEGPTTQTTATFAFAAPDAASFECRLVGRDFAPCTDSATFTDLADGEYTFQVRALDAAGNVEEPAAARSFTVDTTGPDTTITAAPGALISDPNPSLAFTASEPGAAFRCAVDGGAAEACTSPFTTPALSDGSRTITVTAVDALGNADPTPATSTFRVDTTAPETTLTSAPPTSSTSVVADFGFAASENATFECRITPAPFATCPSPLKLGPLEPGSYELEVRARDAAGLLDASPAVSRFTVLAPATAAPVTAVSAPSPAVPAPTNVPPVLSGLKVRARCSRSTTRSATFTLSEDAEVRFVLLRRRSPAWRSCPSVSNARREDRTPVTTIGRGSIPFDGGDRVQTVATTRPALRRARAAATEKLIDAAKLRPGTYVLMAVARDAGGAESATVSAKFWVLAPRKR